MRKVQRSLGRRFRLIEDERGTAMTETAIMLPVFLMIWGGILYTFVLGRSILEMQVNVRRDAWTYAYAGCRGDTGDTNISEESITPSGAPGVSIPLFGAIMDFVSKQFHANREDTVSSSSLRRENQIAVDVAWVCNEHHENYRIANMGARIFGMFGL